MKKNPNLIIFFSLHPKAFFYFCFSYCMCLYTCILNVILENASYRLLPLIFHSIYAARLEIREFKKIQNQSFSEEKNFFLCVYFLFGLIACLPFQSWLEVLNYPKRRELAVVTKSAELSLKKKAHFFQDSSPIL